MAIYLFNLHTYSVRILKADSRSVFRFQLVHIFLRTISYDILTSMEYCSRLK